MVEKMATKKGAPVRAQGILYNTVVQAVLLYGSDTWVVTGSMNNVIEILHHWVAIRSTGVMTQRKTSRKWEWPLVAETLENAVLWPIKEYIQQRNATKAVQMD